MTHASGDGVFDIRMMRSPWSEFYGREIEDCLKTHPDSYLKEISREGFNAIWLHCILRDIVSCKAFPEFGARADEQIPALNSLVEKAGRYGLKVFLYLCEPRGFREEDPFWGKYPGCKGHNTRISLSGDLSGRYSAFCSSTDRVRDFLYQSSYNLFAGVPGLGGVFMITASEFVTHCYSHFPKLGQDLSDPNIAGWSKNSFHCERCDRRDPSEVVSEIITLVNSGIKDANPRADVIAWNWSWYIIEPDPQKKIVKGLPRDVIIQADFERGGYKNVLGKRLLIDEYSFSYTGPSPRFKKIFNLAKRRGMRSTAKLQVGTTHELVTVPYIPVPYIIAEKLARMKRMGVDGYQGCWIFGGNVSPMSKVAGRMSVNPDISSAQAVKEVALEEFGEASAAGYVTRAWRQFSHAWKHYPFSIPFLYYSPINYATAYPLDLSAESIDAIPSWLPLPRDKKGRLAVGDNLETWLTPFSAHFAVDTFKKLLEGWGKGVSILEQGAEKCRPNQRYQKELDMAVHISLIIKSTVNIIDFYRLLREYRQKRGSEDVNAQMKHLLKEEAAIVIQDREIIGRNPDFGYHAEAHTSFITMADLDYKLRLLKDQAEAL